MFQGLLEIIDTSSWRLQASIDAHTKHNLRCRNVRASPVRIHLTQLFHDKWALFFGMTSEFLTAELTYVLPWHFICQWWPPKAVL